jgi:hypothetical protein
MYIFGTNYFHRLFAFMTNPPIRAENFVGYYRDYFHRLFAFMTNPPIRAENFVGYYRGSLLAAP